MRLLHEALGHPTAEERRGGSELPPGAPLDSIQIVNHEEFHLTRQVLIPRAPSGSFWLRLIPSDSF